MTSLQQRTELQRQIWAIANDVQGSVDEWAKDQKLVTTDTGTVLVDKTADSNMKCSHL